MLADEIQTGLGRTGKLFACDHEGIKPDLYIIAKALGGGIIPISAIVGTTDVMEVFTPGTHGSTFGGNPMACAIALEVINILKEDEIIKNASNVGRYFVEKLTLLNLPKVVQIRARGLLIGVEIDKKFGPAYPICEQLAKLGILCKDTQAQTIRFTPPLTITTSDIDWALERISQVL